MKLIKQKLKENQLNQSYFFEKKNKIHKPLARMTK